MSKNTRKKSPWTILVVMLISMVAGAICMNKVAPVLSNIMADLNITSGSQAGLLMSIFTFSGIILSIPMGVLITKYGTFKTGLFFPASTQTAHIPSKIPPTGTSIPVGGV